MSRMVLLASHGDLARGMKNAAEVIVGPRPDLVATAPYSGDMDHLIAQVQETLARVEPHETLYLLTDLVGGSVNNSLMTFLADPRVVLVTGMNLGLVLETVLAASSAADMDRIIAAAASGLRRSTISADINDEEF